MQKYGKTERELEEEEEKNINLEVKGVRRQCNTGEKKNKQAIKTHSGFLRNKKLPYC